MRSDTTEWEMNISSEVKISRGEYTLPYLTLIDISNNVIDKFVIVSHSKGRLPRKRNLITKQSECTEGYLWYEVEYCLFDVLEKALSSWNENKSPSLVSYTYLYAYAKALGVDLHKDLHIM